jgi:hypothetical protein
MLGSRSSAHATLYAASRAEGSLSESTKQPRSQATRRRMMWWRWWLEVLCRAGTRDAPNLCVRVFCMCVNYVCDDVVEMVVGGVV